MITNLKHAKFNYLHVARSTAMLELQTTFFLKVIDHYIHFLNNKYYSHSLAFSCVQLI